MSLRLSLTRSDQKISNRLVLKLIICLLEGVTFRECHNLKIIENTSVWLKEWRFTKGPSWHPRWHREVHDIKLFNSITKIIISYVNYSFVKRKSIRLQKIVSSRHFVSFSFFFIKNLLSPLYFPKKIIISVWSFSPKARHDCVFFLHIFIHLFNNSV